MKLDFYYMLTFLNFILQKIFKLTRCKFDMFGLISTAQMINMINVVQAMTCDMFSGTHITILKSIQVLVYLS